jgi:hypothetical protein
LTALHDEIELVEREDVLVAYAEAPDANGDVRVDYGRPPSAVTITPVS